MITDISKSSLDAAIMISENSKIIIQTKQFNDYYLWSKYIINNDIIWLVKI